MASFDDILRQLRAADTATDAEIVTVQGEVTTLDNNIVNVLQPEYEQARKRFLDTPHGNAQERHDREAHRESLDDARAALSLSRENLDVI